MDKNSDGNFIDTESEDYYFTGLAVCETLPNTTYASLEAFLDKGVINTKAFLPSNYHGSGEYSLVTAYIDSGDNILLNEAINRGTIAIGYSTKAEGEYSFAEGRETYALGDYSHTAGTGTYAGEDNQFIIGTYNENKQTTLFEIGYGDNDESRKNIFEVHDSGKIVASTRFQMKQEDGNGTEIISINYDGRNSNATALDSTIAGTVDIGALANQAFAVGKQTIASGIQSFAQGNKT
jgi:hypothetical protein